MAKPIDYSKWKDIEVSDDEDDTHPNIDTPSLFRWRHQARVDKMEQHKQEKEVIATSMKSIEQHKSDIRKNLEEAEKVKDKDAIKKYESDLKKVEDDEKKWRDKEDEIVKKERLQPWNVDTIGHDGFSKTVINKPRIATEKKDLTDEELAEKQTAHEEKYEKMMKKFGMIKRHDDSRQFLIDNRELVCDETANYLVLWCIRLEMEEKHELMDHVAHQTIVMQFILELAKSLNFDPRDCISSFFTRIKTAEKQYLDAFQDELESFKRRVRERAAKRVADAVKAAEEEERAERLGPGGLDPVEVYDSLPSELQDCFDKQDIPMLQKVLTSMPEEEAQKHLHRCIDSGLWVPDAKKAEEEAAGTAQTTETAEK